MIFFSASQLQPFFYIITRTSSSATRVLRDTICTNMYCKLLLEIDSYNNYTERTQSARSKPNVNRLYQLNVNVTDIRLWPIVPAAWQTDKLTFLQPSLYPRHTKFKGVYWSQLVVGLAGGGLVAEFLSGT